MKVWVAVNGDFKLNLRMPSYCVSADVVNLFCAIQFSQASGDLHTVAVGGPPASQHVDSVSFICSKYEGPRLKFGDLRTVRSR